MTGGDRPARDPASPVTGGEQLVRQERNVVVGQSSPDRSTTNTDDSPDPAGSTSRPATYCANAGAALTPSRTLYERPYGTFHSPSVPSRITVNPCATSSSRHRACGLRLTWVGSAAPTHAAPEIACPRPSGSGVATSVRPPGTSTRRQVSSAVATASSSRCSRTCTATTTPKACAGRSARRSYTTAPGAVARAAPAAHG